MPSQQNKVDFIVGQIAGGDDISSRKMFGEHAIYCGPKLVALVCDDQLFVKSTQTGKAFAGELREGQPYPNAKPNLVVPEEKWNDSGWLTELIRMTAAELPMPKLKAKKGN